jgi:Hypervirulence associated proteins TUDOR domain
MAEFKRGDRVKWKSHGGEAGRKVNASKDEPQYLVKSEKSGGEAVHKPEALERA